MIRDAAPGRIVSFYSFKGGVGRTMALANIAFLAAMNGLRVLVMDWDLEAPGLHHYFRGIMEPEDAARLKDASGVLDLAWEWRNRVEAAVSKADIDLVFSDFASGEPFKRNLFHVFEVGSDHPGKIDMAPAGGRVVNTPQPVTYEQALAAFSWSDFMERHTGGGMIGALRAWASSEYDLILVDSRTGLADVAGICTMQLPDALVLAFVLNRQNIEGVSRVAGAVRKVRGDQVRMWAVPMRTSREGTAEEADASARAVREMVRFGGFTREQAERDMKGLPIQAEPNVPFMESLAPFNQTDAALDPLTANLARLTREIIGRNVTIPTIDERWRDVVLSRLAPALSTVAYLRQMLTAEPERATRELHKYLESALSALAEEQSLPDDYVTALAETALALQQRGDPLAEHYDLVAKTGLLARRLHDADHERWRALLIVALQASLETMPNLFFEDNQINTLEEIESLLANDRPSPEVLSRMAETRLRIARLHGSQADATQQVASADTALAHARRARKESAVDTDDLRLLRLEAMLQKAEGLESLDQPDAAVEALTAVAKATNDMLATTQRSEASRLSFEANYRLMRLSKVDVKAAAGFAQVAVSRTLPGAAILIGRLPELGGALVAGANRMGATDLLLHLMPTSVAAAQSIANSPRAAVALVTTLGELVTVADLSAEPLKDACLAAAAATASQVLAAVKRRASRNLGRFSLEHASRQVQAIYPVLMDATDRLADIIAASAPAAQAVSDAVAELRITAHNLRRTPAVRGHPPVET